MNPRTLRRIRWSVFFVASAGTGSDAAAAGAESAPIMLDLIYKSVNISKFIFFLFPISILRFLTNDVILA